MLDSYYQKVETRKKLGVVPKPLTADEVVELTNILLTPPADKSKELLDLLENRIPPGVDEAAEVKAAFLAAIARGEKQSPIVSKAHAVELLGTMLGGFNVEPLIALLSDQELAPVAAKALSHTLLVFDAFDKVSEIGRAHV